MGLLTPLQSAFEEKNLESLFGHGVGSSGNLVKIHLKADMDDDEWLGGGAESGLGLLVYQIGLVGAALILSLVMSIYNCLKSDISRSAWLIYWVNVLLQENLINLNYLIAKH